MLFLEAQKGYPPWAVSPPQIKGRPPPISKPQPAAMIFFVCVLQIAINSAMNWFNNYINIAWSFLIHLANIFLQCGNFKTPKLENKTHPPNDRFLIKI